MNIETLGAILAKVVEAARESSNNLPEGTADAMAAIQDLLSTTNITDLTDLKLVSRRENIGSLLIKLSELTKFGKQEWVDLAETYGIELDLNPRDSARDVMGKLARHLHANPAAMEKAAVQYDDPKNTTTKSSTRGKRHLAENLQETLARLLEE